MDKLTVLCEPLQWTHLQRPLLRMSPTAGDETSRGRNPKNGRCWENCEPVQWTHLQWPLLRMSPTAGDETSRGRNPENGRCWDFGRWRQHRQSGFQHTYRPWPSSPELFNKDHNAARESLSHLIKWSVNSMNAGQPCLTHHHRDRWNEMNEWMRWVQTNGRMKFVAGETLRNACPDSVLSTIVTLFIQVSVHNFKLIYKSILFFKPW